MAELRKLKRVLDRARTTKERHLALEDLAEHFLNHGDFEEALEYYKMELEAARDLQSDEKVAKAHRMIGEAQLELAEFDKALKNTQKYYDWACADEGRIVEQQRALTTLGRTNFVKATSIKSKDSTECKEAFCLAEKSLWMSLKICEKLDKKLPSKDVNDMRARSLLNLGLTLEGSGKFDQATTQYDVAIRLCRKYKIDSTLRMCCLGYASFLIRQKAFEKAIKLYQEAFSSLKSISDASERARKGAEILFSESEGHLSRGDVHSARRALQKAYKMLRKSSIHENCSHVTDRLKLVAAMDILQRELLNPDLPPKEMAKKYEGLGDGFSSLGMFSNALTKYEKMLEYGKIAGMDLRACYASLGQTCRDLREYQKAIRYFEQELLYPSKTPEDTCYTLLSIQECQDTLKLPPTKQLEILVKAADTVEKTNKPKLKKKILKKLHKVQVAAKSKDAEETVIKLNLLDELSSEDEDVDDEDGPLEQTPNIGDYIDLDALTDEIEEEDEDFVTESTFMPAAVKLKHQPHRRKPVSNRRNEKGETKLHVACMNNKINAVKTILAEGCDINATDNAGWTPLHEACNHGYIDIVEQLLKNGADINSKGGQGTGGITPLYDAGQAGNFDVIEYLLDHNASVAVLTDNGETALDALNAFYARAENSLTAEEKQQFECVKDRLHSCLKIVGLPVNETKGRSLVQRQEETLPKGPSPRGTTGNLRRLIDDNVDLDSINFRNKSMREISPMSSPIDVSSSESDEDQVNGEGMDGVSEYINAIQGVRKQTKASTSTNSSRRKKTLEPLVNENQVGDNWLEDDIGKQPTKKRKSDHSQTSDNSTYKPLPMKKRCSSRLSLNSCSSSRASSVADVREDHRWSNGSRNSDSMEMDINERNLEDDRLLPMEREDSHDAFEDSWANNSYQPEPYLEANPPTINKTHQSSLLTYGITKTPQNSQMMTSQLVSQIGSSALSCVNVQVEEHRLAIFVQDPSLSIGWLANEAARRYKKLQGCLPTLSIHSLDGALYSDEDPVQVVLGNDVVGFVDSWNDSCISERYKEACESSSTNIRDDILSLLEESQMTRSLDIKDTVYPAQIFKPIFRVLSLERNLASLNLSTNLLQDKGVADLSGSLSKLINLKDLDLSGNNISAVGVGELAKAAKKDFMKVLQRLNLSYNNLGDASLPHLIDITASVPQLLHLHLADCMLTKAIGEKCDGFLSLNHLETLDLSHNALCAKGLARFLGFGDHNEDRRLNPERLRNLCLIGLEGDRLCPELILFLEQGNSIALKTLHFSFTTMKDEELAQLLSFLRSAPELHTIRILSAKNVKPRTVCQLLEQQPHLRQLEIRNTKAIWKNYETDIVTSITHAASCGLETLTLRDLPESAKSAWRLVKGPAAIIRELACGLQILSSNS